MSMSRFRHRISCSRPLFSKVAPRFKHHATIASGPDEAVRGVAKTLVVVHDRDQGNSPLNAHGAFNSGAAVALQNHFNSTVSESPKTFNWINSLRRFLSSLGVCP